VIGRRGELARPGIAQQQYGTRIIISDATRARLRRPYQLRALGDVVVKGQDAAGRDFEVRWMGTEVTEGRIHTEKTAGTEDQTEKKNIYLFSVVFPVLVPPVNPVPSVSGDLHRSSLCAFFVRRPAASSACWPTACRTPAGQVDQRTDTEERDHTEEQPQQRRTQRNK